MCWNSSQFLWDCVFSWIKYYREGSEDESLGLFTNFLLSDNMQMMQLWNLCRSHWVCQWHFYEIFLCGYRATWFIYIQVDFYESVEKYLSCLHKINSKYDFRDVFARKNLYQTSRESLSRFSIAGDKDQGLENATKDFRDIVWAKSVLLVAMAPLRSMNYIPPTNKYALY